MRVLVLLVLGITCFVVASAQVDEFDEGYLNKSHRVRVLTGGKASLIKGDWKDDPNFDWAPKTLMKYADLKEACERSRKTISKKPQLYTVRGQYISCFSHEDQIPIFVVHGLIEDPNGFRTSFKWTGVQGVSANLYKQATNNNNKNHKYDRGHLSPNGDWKTVGQKKNTFNAINRAPQVDDFNRNAWRCIEQSVRELRKAYAGKKVIVFTWLTLEEGESARAGYKKSKGAGSVIPTVFSKLVLVLEDIIDANSPTLGSAFCVTHANELPGKLVTLDILRCFNYMPTWGSHLTTALFGQTRQWSEESLIKFDEIIRGENGELKCSPPSYIVNRQQYADVYFYNREKGNNFGFWVSSSMCPADRNIIFGTEGQRLVGSEPKKDDRDFKDDLDLFRSGDNDKQEDDDGDDDTPTNPDPEYDSSEPPADGDDAMPGADDLGTDIIDDDGDDPSLDITSIIHNYRTITPYPEYCLQSILFYILQKCAPHRLTEFVLEQKNTPVKGYEKREHRRSSRQAEHQKQEQQKQPESWQCGSPEIVIYGTGTSSLPQNCESFFTKLANTKKETDPLKLRVYYSCGAAGDTKHWGMFTGLLNSLYLNAQLPQGPFSPEQAAASSPQPHNAAPTTPQQVTVKQTTPYSSPYSPYKPPKGFINICNFICLYSIHIMLQ